MPLTRICQSSPVKPLAPIMGAVFLCAKHQHSNQTFNRRCIKQRPHELFLVVFNTFTFGTHIPMTNHCLVLFFCQFLCCTLNQPSRQYLVIVCQIERDRTRKHGLCFAYALFLFSLIPSKPPIVCHLEHTRAGHMVWLARTKSVVIQCRMILDSTLELTIETTWCFAVTHPIRTSKSSSLRYLSIASSSWREL